MAQVPTRCPATAFTATASPPWSTVPAMSGGSRPRSSISANSRCRRAPTRPGARARTGASATAIDGRALRAQRSPRRPQCGAHNLLGLLQDALQVRGVAKALGVDLVDILGARGSGGEPAVGGLHLQPADRCIVTRCARQHAFDLLPGEFARLHLLG